MQDNNLYNNERDRFDKLLSSKLEDHRLPVDANCWEEIEKRIRPKQKKMMWWYLGSAAVIVGLLMLFVLPLKDNMNRDNTVAETTKFEQVDDSIEEKQIAEQIVEKMSDEVQEMKKPSTQQLTIKKEVEQIPATGSDVDSTEPSLIIPKDELTEIEMPKKEDAEEENEDRRDNLDSKQKKDTLKNRDFEQELLKQFAISDDKPLLAKADSDDGWTFGLNVGGGAAAFKMLNFNDDLYFQDMGNVDGEYTQEIPITQKEWDVDYRLPISVGFMLRKDFNSIVGLETGLVYTYLSSDMKRETYSPKERVTTSQKGETQIHYLGLPVNLVLQAWNNPKWSIYVSGGLMLEKGIGMKQKIHTYRNGEEARVERHTKNWVHGAQWSINGSVGVSYNLSPSWSLYLEPRMSYYFDGKQPVSIRTEKPTLFNLSGGIRFNVK